jgi:carbamoyl-phosphate synthase large subunit
MRRQCRVLVTGAGSGVGQGIVKALRASGLPVTVVAADIAPMNVALYCAEEAVLIPRVEAPDALEAIISLLLQQKIDVVMIGSEFDLSFFSANRQEIESRSGAIVIAAPLKTVAIADDKWLTAEFLREHGLPYAEAHLPADADDAVRVADAWGYPIVLKTRRGTSSRHVYIVNARNELLKLYPETPLPMLQRVIDIPSSQLGSEYTCSVFKTADGRMIGPFTARRTVRGGTSWHIEVADFDVLHAPLLAIAGAIDYIGSLNVQLMLTRRGAIPFELNARFSGTTAVRAHFGFNEPAMALLTFYYNEEVPAPMVRSGIAMRYHEEVFIEGVNKDSLTPGQHKGVVNLWF